MFIILSIQIENWKETNTSDYTEIKKIISYLNFEKFSIVLLVDDG